MGLTIPGLEAHPALRLVTEALERSLEETTLTLTMKPADILSVRCEVVWASA